MPLEGLLPGTPAIADGAAAPIPPPITRVPGLPPSRNTMSAGIGMAGWLTSVPHVPAYPRVATFTRVGEKTCGSFQLRGWARRSERQTKFGTPPPPPPHAPLLEP